MIVEVVEEGRGALAEYARISIAFEVREVVEVGRALTGVHRFVLTPRPVEVPYLKDYDAEGGPETWGSRFDLSHWRFFAARVDGARVGGAAVVLGAPDVEMLGGRPDVALLWDIRVAASRRRHGVGALLISSVEAWSAAHGARWLEVETQNVNVPACRFYERQGFVLREVNAQAYPFLPNEIQFLWYKQIDG